MKTWIAVALVVAGMGSAGMADVGPRPPGGVYDGHKVVRVVPATPRQLMTVLALTDDVWSHGHAVGSPVDVRMSPAQYGAFLGAAVPHEVVVQDVQALIEQERREIENPPENAGWFEAHKTNAQILARLEELAAAHADLATLSNIGTSIENRDIWSMRITGPGSTVDRPVIMIHGTQHAREWASPMTTMYFVDRLLTTYATDPRVKTIVDNVEFHIVPVSNPDGYEYTWTPGNRLWRKNRRVNQGSTCMGVDLNRNWAYQWGNNNGSSGNPCSDIYRGEAPFSEPETQVLRDLALSLQDRLVLNLDIHSYSQLILSPWGYTTEPPPDIALMNKLGKLMADAIKSIHGMTYTYGQGSVILYVVSGGSRDWFYGSLGSLGYTIELRDKGQYGFVMPASQYLPTAEENMEALLDIALYFVSPIIITLPNGVPQWLEPNQPTTIAVEIDAADEPVESAKVFWRVGTGGSFSSANLAALGGTSYEATLPGTDCPNTVQFYFTAQTQNGKSAMLPFEGPAAPLEAQALKSLLTFEDEMETDLGWKAGEPGDTATSGLWERADPEGTAAQPEDDHTPPPGVNCYVTGAIAGPSIGFNDVDNGHTTLTSPVFSALSPSMAVGEPYVSYWRWYSNNKGNSPNQKEDAMSVLISNDSGQTWVSVEEVLENADAWVAKSWKVSDFVAPTETMKLRFIARDMDPGSIVEAAIDDVRVEVIGCEGSGPCYADCNKDGKLNIDDFLCFQLKFALADPAADCDGNGLMNIDDFICFQLAFALGCP